MMPFFYASQPGLHFPGAGLYFQGAQWVTRPGSGSCKPLVRYKLCYSRLNALWIMMHIGLKLVFDLVCFLSLLCLLRPAFTVLCLVYS